MEPLAKMLEVHARIRGLLMRLGDEVVGGNVRPETLRAEPASSLVALAIS